MREPPSETPNARAMGGTPAILHRLIMVLGAIATGIAILPNAPLRASGRIAQTLPLADPNYVTWYTLPPASPWPTPISSAYVGIGGALGAANVYNTATNGHGSPGTGLLAVATACFFLCYGAPGVASDNVVAAGTDVSASNSFMTLGAPDDCGGSTPPLCPGGISDQVFALEGYASPTATPTVLIAVDKNANFAVFNDIYAGSAVIAGAGHGTPAPVPSLVPGSLVSFTGNGKDSGAGEILLGSMANSAKCDYDETYSDTLTCNQPLVISSGGVRPNGASGGYAPEALPLGATEQDPKILTGTCSVTVPFTSCTFPNSFAFGDTNFNCVITSQSSTPASSSYTKASSSRIVIYTGQSAVFSYMCTE